MCKIDTGKALLDDIPEKSTRIGEGVRILLCSENVPPQVNGIARRVGHYADGLRRIGCDVNLLHPDSGYEKVLPHVNPWNFTAKMMCLLPGHLFQLVNESYDVIHVVLPLNLSGMWLLAAYKIRRCIIGESSPCLVLSWHCNLVDYINFHSPPCLRDFFFICIVGGLCSMLPSISDRILTPTKATEPNVVSMWEGRSGVCYTGIEKGSFTPLNKDSEWGRRWGEEKKKCLKEYHCEFLLVCVGRLSPEKGCFDLIKALPMMERCALWFVGDGPSRLELEVLSKNMSVPVNFLGYQEGESLHATYAIADCFVCPSLTETFRQTVNEALASQVRVALPSVPVFVEAYSDIIPNDAFWEPTNRQSMVKTIVKQLDRYRKKDPKGIPDLEKLRSWDDTCELLLEEYKEAMENRQKVFKLSKIILFPFWYAITFMAAVWILYMSTIRTICGGSFRALLCTVPKRVENGLKDVKRNYLPKRQETLKKI